MQPGRPRVLSPRSSAGTIFGSKHPPFIHQGPRDQGLRERTLEDGDRADVVNKHSKTLSDKLGRGLA